MDRPETRVVVTGLGVVSSIGTGVAEFAAGLAAGRSGVSEITAFDTAGFPSHAGCEVRGFDPARHLRRTDPAELNRADQFAVAAAALALADAGVDPDDGADRDGLVSIGSTDAESHSLEALAAAGVAGALADVPAAVFGRVPAHRLATSIAREFGWRRAETVCLPTACAAGNYAIGYAYDALRLGEAEFALAGGADAMSRKTFAGFTRLGTVAPDVCRPFSVDRRGILTGEGAGVLHLETLASALDRGATVYGEVLGYGLTCDATHMVAPDRTSIARCMTRAHTAAGVKPEQVDLVSAHGTGTPANDATEAGAVHDVFGDDPPPVVSVKSMLGHTMGAASALAAAACAIALDAGFIPPTIHHTTTDPECAVDCVPDTARRADLRIVQNNALAFGGNNAVLLLGACADAPRRGLPVDLSALPA